MALSLQLPARPAGTEMPEAGLPGVAPWGEAGPFRAAPVDTDPPAKSGEGSVGEVSRAGISLSPCHPGLPARYGNLLPLWEKVPSGSAGGRMRGVAKRS
jgi:hypothetical protein